MMILSMGRRLTPYAPSGKRPTALAEKRRRMNDFLISISARA
jgi:hypothetical protein